jgi:hypothetical protein
MMTVLVVSMFLLVFIILPGSISRVVGAKLGAKILFSTGAFVLPVLIGLSWSAVLAGGCDAALLLAGASLASRMNFSHAVCTIWTKRIATVFSALLFVAFAALAILATYVTGQAMYALPFDFGVLMSGIAFAALLSRRQELVLTRNGAGSLVSASSQA